MLVLVAAAPGLWLLHGLVGAQRANREQSALGVLRAAARHAKEQQLANMLGARGLVEAFAETRPVQERNLSECSALAAKLLAKDSQFANIGAVEPDGTIFCNGLRIPPFSAADRRWVSRALQLRSFVAGNYHIGRASKH